MTRAGLKKTFSEALNSRDLCGFGCAETLAPQGPTIEELESLGSL